MRCSSVLIIAALCVCASGQAPPVEKVPGLPPRLAATDYQSHASAGTVTIAAEFTGHSVPTPQETLNSEDYVVVETALFGPADTKLILSVEDFALRVNGKKTLPRQPFGMVFQSLKNPELEPPASAAKSKTNVGSGGQGDSAPPPVYHIPPDVKHAMQQHVQKAALPLGERGLPVAGLIFFQYRGKTQNIQSLELIYSGPAGKATLALQP
ncbi:MAG: hypothetical protein ABJF23_16290 [Bryobacteraceae bacterium]